jgi:hypothetical protein
VVNLLVAEVVEAMAAGARSWPALFALAKS